MSDAVLLRGERVTLRTIECDETDLDLLGRVYNDPDFREGFLFRCPRNREEVESLAEPAEDEDDLHLLVCVNGEPIGAVRLFDVTHGDHGTLSYWLLPEHRGAGYATEATALVCDHAFRTLGLHRVAAWTIAYNEASRTLLRRLGFVHEGTFREEVFRTGEYHDTEHYGLLASEWEGSDAAFGSPKG